MHKKLEADLVSLAHSLLQMKNKEDVFALKEKAYEIYEKLSVLAHIEEYIKTTPNAKETKEELILEVEKSFEQKQEATQPIEEKETVIPLLEDKIIDDKKEVSEEEKETVEEQIIEQPFDEIEELLFSDDDDVKNDVRDVGERKTVTLEEELEDTISVDVMANLFDNAMPKSLNDKLQTSIQIGLNDRIAFVKNLFNGSQEDFNKMVSQLNTFKTENEAKKFINKTKHDYNWSEYEDLEARFIEIIERRFV
ncbi:MAG: hypothetical protein ACPGTO_10715 [Polaribacter sp.]